MVDDHNTAVSETAPHWLDDRPGLFISAWLLWGCALLCTLIAMLAPFMSLKIIFKSEQTFSILQTLGLMWSHGMYTLAVLICGFSICFPFYKLYCLYGFLRCNAPSTMEVKRLHFVGRFGKWSMLDAFIVSFLLGLTSDQFTIHSHVKGGIYIFIFAILMSILLGTILQSAYHRSAHTKRYHRQHSKVSILILSIASIAMIGLCFIPFIEIDGWKLRDRSFTLVSFIATIIGKDNSLLIGILFAALLIILPFLEIISLWLMPTAIGARFRLYEFYQAMRHWSCLEVFILSLMVFLIEGDSFMKTHINTGFYLMILALSAYATKSFARMAISSHSMICDSILIADNSSGQSDSNPNQTIHTPQSTGP